MVVRVPVSKDSPEGIGWATPSHNRGDFTAGIHPQAQIDSYPFPPDTFYGTLKLTLGVLARKNRRAHVWVCHDHHRLARPQTPSDA